MTTSVPRPLDRVDRIQAAWRRERPEIDVTPQGVFGRLHRVAALLTAELTAVYREHGLSEGEFDVLATLRRAGEPFEHAPGELADHTMVTSGAMTKRIDRLTAEGLVTREHSPGDQRRRTIRLTAKGRELIDRAFDAHMANERRLLDEISITDATALERALTAWLAQLEAPPAPQPKH